MSTENETWIPGKKFDDFLKEQGIYEETKVRAEYEVLVELVQEFMQSEKISKVEFGKLALTLLESLGKQLESKSATSH